MFAQSEYRRYGTEQAGTAQQCVGRVRDMSRFIATKERVVVAGLVCLRPKGQNKHVVAD